MAIMKKALSLLLLTISPLTLADFCENAKEAGYDAIRNVVAFNDREIGIAGHKPNWYREYDCISDEENAEVIFESLILNSTLAGQLYGLKGLLNLNQTIYERHAPKYKDDDTEVTTVFGCVVGRMRVGKIVKDLLGSD